MNRGELEYELQEAIKHRDEVYAELIEYFNTPRCHSKLLYRDIVSRLVWLDSLVYEIEKTLNK